VQPTATERPAAETPVQPPAADPAPPLAAEPAPPPAPAREAGALDAVALRSLWPEVLNVIESGSRTIRALLEGSQVLEATGNTVTLAVRASLAKRLAEERNVAAISQGLAKVVGGTWQIVIKAASGASAQDEPAVPPGRATPAPPPDSDPRDDADYEPAAPAEAAAVDPEAEAMKLLRDELGARPLE
jgi:DNA polymerase III subunit gamma/tau